MTIYSPVLKYMFSYFKHRYFKHRFIVMKTFEKKCICKISKDAPLGKMIRSKSKSSFPKIVKFWYNSTCGICGTYEYLL